MPGITDLPEDLLVPIFSLARESPLDLLQFGYVWSDWRRIIYSTGALFADITAGTDYDTDVSFNQLSRLLALSREAPLYLTVRCWVEKDYDITCAAILDHMGHIRELQLYVDVLNWESHGTAVCPLRSALSVSAPMLEDVLIDLDGGQLWAVVDYQLFDGFAPRLTRLQLHGVEITNPTQPALARVEYFLGPGAISDTTGSTALVAHALTLGQLFPALADLTLTDCTSCLAVTKCDGFPTHLDSIDICYCRELRDDESDEIETGFEALRGLEAANWRGASSIAVAFPPEGLVPLLLDELSSGADAVEGVDFGNSTDIRLGWSCLVFYTKSTKVLRFTDIPDEDVVQLATSRALQNVDDVTFGFGPTVMDDLSNWTAPQFLSRFFDTARNVTQLNIIIDHFPARTELLSGWKSACTRVGPDPWRIPVRNLTELNVTARSSATAPVTLAPAVIDDFLTNVLDFGAPDRKLRTLFLHYVHLTWTSDHAHTVLSPHVLMCLELPDPFCNDA